MKPLTRVTDTAVPHTCDTTHTPTIIKGSDVVFVDGLAVGVVGSNFDCGDVVSTGSDIIYTDGYSNARRGDKTNGHGCFPSTIINTGSGVVYGA